MEEKATNQVQEITDRLEAGIKDLFESDHYKKYLDTMSKFHNYSLNNTILICMQKPDASFVAGYKAWKEIHERQVLKGEKAIKILAPAPYKKMVQQDKINPETGKIELDGNGIPIKETVEIKVPHFRVVNVFDISQTEGKELPTLVSDLNGDVQQYDLFFEALKRSCPVPIAFENIASSAKGYFNRSEQRIAIKEGMSQMQTIKTAIHEMAHQKMHGTDENALSKTRNEKEVEAESVAYTICQHYGIDTSDYSFGYIAGWSEGKELSELKTSLETIKEAASEIIDKIDGHFAELLETQEVKKLQEAEAEIPLDPSTEPIVTIIWSEHGRFHDGETMSLSEANALIGSLDEAAVSEDGYYKTKFRIDFVMDGKSDYYVGRQDLGDGEGNIIDHIEKYHTYYENNTAWDNYLLRNGNTETLEADKAYRDMLLHEFVPYLRLHDNLSQMEQAATRALQENEAMTSAETAYHTAMQSYVSECRERINQGEYNLPPEPRLADFDVELQEYKAHVEEEIALEAAAAGMTVEEYAANGYEPYSVEQQEYGTKENTENTFTIYQLKDDAPVGYHFRSLERLQENGLAVDPINYEKVYDAPLTPGMNLERIFEKFNIDHPEDFKGHFLSVSDVIVLHQNGKDTAHYTDSIGFVDISKDFLLEHPLKAAEVRQETAAQKQTEPEQQEAVQKQEIAIDTEKHHLDKNGTVRPSVLQKLNEKKQQINEGHSEKKQIPNKETIR